MSTEQKVLVEASEHILTITFNRPENSMRSTLKAITCWRKPYTAYSMTATYGWVLFKPRVSISLPV